MTRRPRRTPAAGTPDNNIAGQMPLWDLPAAAVRYPMAHCRVANELHLRGWLEADPTVAAEAANRHHMCPGRIERTNLDGTAIVEICTCACHATPWTPTSPTPKD